MSTENELVTELAGIQRGIRRMDADIERRKTEIASLERIDIMPRIPAAAELLLEVEPIVARPTPAAGVTQDGG